MVSLPMLGWLAAAAAPILIHLWSRRKHREVVWAAMQFLLLAIKKRQRRLVLEQWLLLCVRTLIIVLVVLAVFLSFQHHSVFSLSGEQQTHRLLVLDCSYSMVYRAGDLSRFERAKQIAAQIIQQCPAGDGFTLISMAGPPRIVVGTPAFERRELLDELDHLELSPTTVDLSATLADAQRVIQKALRDQPRLARHEVYFLTDLGRVGWSPPPHSATAEEVRRRAEQLSQTASLVIIDVGQPNAENNAVTSLSIVEPVATVGRPLHFEARLRNFGRSDQPGRTVELWADGRRVAQQHVDLPAALETTVTMTSSFDTAGDHAVELRLQPDRLELDDHRWLALPVRQAIRVLCFDGQAAGQSSHGASDYLRLALAPQADAEPALVQPEVVPESGLLERDLAPFDAVFLCNIAQFTPSETRVLQNYLNRGGSLIFFLGDRVLADRYNQQLGGPAGSADRLLPARLGDLVSTPQTRLDPLQYQHPIVRVFRDRERSGLLTTPVAKHFHLEVVPNGKARTVVALAGGDPLIVEEPVRRGRVILVATSADTAWTDMPRWPSFVPLVQEMLAYCLSGQIQHRNQLVGQAIEGELPAASAASTPAIVLPSGRSEPLQTQVTGDRSVWTYPETNTAGIYTVRLGGSPPRSAMYAVNLDTAESDLAPLPLETLQNEVWPGVPLAYQTTWQNSDHAAIGPGSEHDSLPVWLLYAALGLLLAEMYLAFQAGHQA